MVIKAAMNDLTGFSLKKESAVREGPPLLLYVFCTLGLVGYLCLYLFRAYKYVTFPYPIDYGEGFMLHSAQFLSQGRSIYRDISQYYSIPGLYPPVYALICAGLVNSFGPLFWTGRFVSAASTLLTGVLIYAIVRQTTQRPIAFISALLFFSSRYVHTWTCLFRVDALGLLFGLAGLYFVSKAKGGKLSFLSVPLFLLSIYTRQSFIAAPLASFVYLFLKNRKVGAVAICLFGCFGLLLLGLANYITAGEFYRHIVIHHVATPFSLQRMSSMITGSLMSSQGLLLAVAVSYILFVFSKKECPLFALYFIAAAIPIFLVGKVGSYVNYFLEIWAATCILSGMAIERLWSGAQGRGWLRILMATLLIFHIGSFEHHIGRIFIPGRRDVLIGQKVSSYVKDTEGMILSEEAGFEVVNGREPIIEPFMATQLASRGLWDQSKLLGDLQGKAFSLIILKFNVNKKRISHIHTERFSKEMIDAMRSNYRIVAKIGRYYILKP